MTSLLEIASNALLLTLFVLLVYILYKRMIVFMNKKSETGVYPEVVRFQVVGNEKLSVDLNIPEKTRVSLFIEDSNGTRVCNEENQELPIGIHTTELSIAGLSTGRYCLLLQSENTKNTRFFHVP